QPGGAGPAAHRPRLRGLPGVAAGSAQHRRLLCGCNATPAGMSAPRARWRPWLWIALTVACASLAGNSVARDSSTLLPGTGTIEYAFTPGDDAAGAVVRAIEAAREQVLVQAFSFTHRDIAMALIRAHMRGV